jgi:hypothetical protein
VSFNIPDSANDELTTSHKGASSPADSKLARAVVVCGSNANRQPLDVAGSSLGNRLGWGADDQPRLASSPARSEHPGPDLPRSTAINEVDGSNGHDYCLLHLGVCSVDVAPTHGALFKRDLGQDARVSLRDGLLSNFQDTSTPGARRERSLVDGYAWSSRTMQTRGSQWRCYVEFCECNGRSIMPVTEANLLDFIGWLSDEKTLGVEPLHPRRLRSI